MIRRQLTPKIVLMFVGIFWVLPPLSFGRAGKWSQKADMPTARFALSTSTVEGKIYAVGGRVGNTILSRMEEYNPLMDKWAKKADMPTPREGFSTSSVGNKIYAIGGGNLGGMLAIVEVYDPVTNNWTRKADMPTPRWGLSTSAVNGKYTPLEATELR